MKTQSRNFRTFLFVVTFWCLAGGGAFTIWQYQKYPNKSVKLGNGARVKVTNPMSPVDKIWRRVGYIQLAAGGVLGIYLLMTRNPYRFIKAAARPMMTFSEDANDADENDA